jgi:hypothetical protein
LTGAAGDDGVEVCGMNGLLGLQFDDPNEARIGRAGEDDLFPGGANVGNSACFRGNRTGCQPAEPRDNREAT